MAMRFSRLLLLIFSTLISAGSVHGGSIIPPEGNSLVLNLKARGFQIYTCTHKLSWKLKRAEAELYDSTFRYRLGFHYFLPKPDAGGGRATWSLSKHTSSSDETPASTITGRAVASISGGAGNIDQLLVQATSHSGRDGLGRVSYVQRIDNKGGLAPSADEETCVAGKTKAVPYESSYTFWIQDDTSNLHGSEYGRDSGAPPAVTLFGDGFQHYVYNGSSWQLVNATAYLSSIPGQEIVGEHFFLEEKDSSGGQPTWILYNEPRWSSVTAKTVATVRAQSEESISWVELEATSSSGDRRFLGEVKYVERRSTRGGLPPKLEVHGTRPRTGEKFASSYSAVYLFYN